MDQRIFTPRPCISAPKRGHLAPIAVAVAAVFAAAASSSVFAADHVAFVKPNTDLVVGHADVVLNLDRISNANGFEWLNESGALFTVDGCDETDPIRTAVQWWYPDRPNDLYSVSSNTIKDFQHGTLTVTNDKGDFNLGWDFGYDNIKPDDENFSPYGPAIANFRQGALNNADTSADQFLKHFTFEAAEGGSQIAIVTRNSRVSSTNAGDGEAMLGLSVLNKRGWMTFADETFLVSDFQFTYPKNIETASLDFTVLSGTEDELPSGTAGEYIAAGVVAGFGAVSNEPLTEGQGLFDKLFTKENGDYTTNLAEGVTDAYLDNYGRIDFIERSVVSVTAVSSEDDGFEEHLGRLHEVFGVLTNEGGNVIFEQGGDVLVKGRDKHHIVSALTSASTLGILDPLKSGKITFSAGEGVNRIWGWSDNYEGSAPVTVGSGHSLNNPEAEPQEKPLFAENGYLDDTAFEDMRGQIEDYLKIATGGNEIVKADQHLRGSILAANDSVITVTDSPDKNGWLDIRGDVVAAVKNGDGAGSNTFVAQGKELSDGVHANSMTGTVTRATVNLTLSHENSTLVGNVYERHRVGAEEAVQMQVSKDDFAFRPDQSTKAWMEDQYKLERATLGGTVDLRISNGAVWYPTKDWKGWNYDFLYQGFFEVSDTPETSKDIPFGSVDKTYAYYDTSDQYNLHVDKDKDGFYEVANAKNSLGDSVKINDLDILPDPKDENAVIATSGLKQHTTETVDAGVYHLYLKGGTVDLSYLRRDFQMSTAQEDLGTIGPDDTIDPGIKKFRIQALNGTSGNFRIYAKDATHHDLVIVDEMRDAANNKVVDASFNLNLVLWNDGIGDEHRLTIDPNKPLTYIQVARVPDSVNVTAESYGQGRTTYTAYRVVKDEKTKDPISGNMVYDKGSYTYDQGLDWHEQNVNWFITGEAENRKDMAVVGTTELAANLGYLMATTMETLRDRRGEMTFNGTKEDGWWVRYTHDRFGLEGFTAETDGFQFGYEWMKPQDGGRLFRGAALDVAQGDVDYDRLSGQSEADRYRLSAYQTYVGNNGVYYDAVLRAGWYDAETNVAYTRDNGTVYDMRGNFDYWAAAASFEAGHRFESSSAWWIEPEVQLQYTYIADYDYKTNQGIRIDTDDTQSLIGRFGVRMGKVLTSDAGRHMSVWAGADVFHEWLGDRDGTMKGVDETVRYDISGDDTWWDAVFGMTWETGPDSRLWAAAKHDFGGDKENTWTVNVGATWNF